MPRAVGRPTPPARVFAPFFTAPPPRVVTVKPVRGYVGGFDIIELTGGDFVDGATIAVDGNACTDVFFGDETDLVGTVPAGVVGLRGVVVTNPDSQTATLVGIFLYWDIPTVSSLSSATGLTPGGSPLTITGTNFSPEATVTFSTIPATSILSVSTTAIVVIPPALAAGVYDVTVTTAENVATLPASYTVSAPSYP